LNVIRVKGVFTYLLLYVLARAAPHKNEVPRGETVFPFEIQVFTCASKFECCGAQPDSPLATYLYLLINPNLIRISYGLFFSFELVT
jgi:hypothetical protein